MRLFGKRLLCNKPDVSFCFINFSVIDQGMHSTGMVKMSHVDDAINEMFQATHMQMMRNCCRLEKMLLASIHMESRAKGCPSMIWLSCLCHVSVASQNDCNIGLRNAMLHCMS